MGIFHASGHTVAVTRRSFTVSLLLIFLMLLQSLSAPGLAQAASTVDCHFSQERQFSLENPAYLDNCQRLETNFLFGEE